MPEGARWIRSRIDGRAGEQLKADPDGQGYVLNFPPDSRSKPVLVEMEYHVPADHGGTAWLPPELREGAVVLQTLWEVQHPLGPGRGGRAAGLGRRERVVLGLYVWKRRPWRSIPRLMAWVAGAAARPPAWTSVLGEEQEGSHGYLFGRAGPPVELRPWVVSRAWLVAICSGSVLLVGFYLMFFKAHLRAVWVAAAAAGLAAAVLAHPSILLLVFQSALSGVILTLLGLLIQRLIERPGQRLQRPARSPAPRRASRPRPALRPERREWAPTTRPRSAFVPPRPWIIFRRWPSHPSMRRPGARASASPGDHAGRRAPDRRPRSGAGPAAGKKDPSCTWQRT